MKLHKHFALLFTEINFGIEYVIKAKTLEKSKDEFQKQKSLI